MATPGKQGDFDSHGHRKFYDFEFVDETLHHLINTHDDIQEDSSNLIKFIRENIIGADYVFKSPYGLRKGRCSVYQKPSTAGVD